MTEQVLNLKEKSAWIKPFLSHFSGSRFFLAWASHFHTRKWGLEHIRLLVSPKILAAWMQWSLTHALFADVEEISVQQQSGYPNWKNHWSLRHSVNPGTANCESPYSRAVCTVIWKSCRRNRPSWSLTATRWFCGWHDEDYKVKTLSQGQVTRKLTGTDFNLDVTNLKSYMSSQSHTTNSRS